MTDLRWLRKNSRVSVQELADELNMAPDEFLKFQNCAGSSRLDRLPLVYKKKIVAAACEAIRERAIHG